MAVESITEYLAEEWAVKEKSQFFSERMKVVRPQKVRNPS